VHKVTLGSITQIIKRHYGADFGLGSYLEETRIDKNKIEEENTEDQIEQDETNESKYNDIIGKLTYSHKTWKHEII
jgi:hypothetical protein